MNILVTKHIHRLDTKNYTLEDIKSEVQECVMMLQSLGYTMAEKQYEVAYLSERTNKCFGRCKSLGNNRYLLSFNRKYLDVGDPKNIHNTIMHEVIHSVNGCMNHQSLWKVVVARINSAFGYSISRTTNDVAYAALYIKPKTVNYSVWCDNCHTRLARYNRKSSTVTAIMNNERRHYCPLCKSRDLFVETVN